LKASEVNVVGKGSRLQISSARHNLRLLDRNYGITESSCSSQTRFGVRPTKSVGIEQPMGSCG
jgi:hypothetical protein